MTLIIWKPCQQQGTCKSRYKARRAKVLAERASDRRLERKISRALSCCTPAVLKTLDDC